MTTMTETLPGLDPGLHGEIPVEEYHRLPGVSQSQLKVLRDLSPAHLRWRLDNPPPSSPAQVIGAAIHDAVLLPDLFETAWLRGIEGDGRTKAVKDARAELAVQHPNATVLSPEAYDTCLAVRNAIAAHPKARQLLIGDAEQSALWLDPDTGILCRGRCDLLGHRTGTIVDLKTTRCAAREPFSRDIWTYGYHMQGAFYLAGAQALGLEMDKFAIVAVEKEPPYGVALYEMTEAAIHDGNREIRPLLALFAECEAAGEWPGYGFTRDGDGNLRHTVELVDLPTWAPNKINERLGEI